MILSEQGNMGHRYDKDKENLYINIVRSVYKYMHNIHIQYYMVRGHGKFEKFRMPIGLQMQY